MGNLSSRKQPTQGLTRRAVTDVTPGVVSNFAGGKARSRDARSDLFTLGVSLMFGEPTFYETADDRADRFRSLVRQVTSEDPDWVGRFLPWLRGTANVRTAAVVGAVEYALAGGPEPRAVIRSVVQRADEPAEVLAYYRSQTGRNPSGGVQRGIADAAVEHYDQYTALKYGSSRRAWTPGDVISLTRPKPRDQQQADLFAYLQPHRRDKAGYTTPETLDRVRARERLTSLSQEQFRSLITDQEVSASDALDPPPDPDAHDQPNVLAAAGMTWEQASSLYGELDAAFWEAMIPSMGYMALLRNLNNFDRAEISSSAQEFVRSVISDPERVATSRQLPVRFMTAYLNRLTDNYARELDAALDASLVNVPSLHGKTLVLVDASGSMGGGYVQHLLAVRHPSTQSRSVAQKSVSMTPALSAMLFGAAVALRSQGLADLVLFSTSSQVMHVPAGASLLRVIGNALPAMQGGATHTWAALQVHLRPDHDRVVILTDMQTQQALSDRGWYNPLRGSQVLPSLFTENVKVPVYCFNLQGYPGTHHGLAPNVVEIGGGLTDASFRAIPLLEQGLAQEWPF